VHFKHSPAPRASSTLYRIEEVGRRPTTRLRQVPVDDTIGGFLRNPSEETFVSVFRTLYAPVYGYFIVRGMDASTAEELVQDVLLTVYRHARDVRDHLCFTGWLFQVARNSLLQHTRKRRTVHESLTGREGEEEVLGQATARFQLAEESDLFDWMQALEEDEREICLMRYMDGLDYQAIAEALHLPMGTVKWKLHQVKKKIAARLAVTHKGPKS
jgi:RNA polymerase sigma-70 factor (ECF subfamily)